VSSLLQQQFPKGFDVVEVGLGSNIDLSLELLVEPVSLGDDVGMYKHTENGYFMDVFFGKVQWYPVDSVGGVLIIT